MVVRLGKCSNYYKTKGYLVQDLQWKRFNLHCMKSVQIRARNNTVFGHSSHSVKLLEFKFQNALYIESTNYT